MDFRDAWARIEDLAGNTFRTERGEEFSYRFQKTYVVVSHGKQSIPRTNFEKVFKRRQQEGVERGPAVQGQKYIIAIFDDERFQ
jgi:hypothetical protein